MSNTVEPWILTIEEPLAKYARWFSYDQYPRQDIPNQRIRKRQSKLVIILELLIFNQCAVIV